MIPVHQYRALICVFHEANAHGFQGDAKLICQFPQQPEINGLPLDFLAQQIARHEQIAGKVIGFAFDLRQSVRTGINALLTAVKL